MLNNKPVGCCCRVHKWPIFCHVVSESFENGHKMKRDDLGHIRRVSWRTWDFLTWQCGWGILTFTCTRATVNTLSFSPTSGVQLIHFLTEYSGWHRCFEFRTFTLHETFHCRMLHREDCWDSRYYPMVVGKLNARRLYCKACQVNVSTWENDLTAQPKYRLMHSNAILPRARCL